jgi:DNA-binding SARP family transcriptional activator/TolB-like protein
LPAFTLKILGDPVLLGPEGPVTGRAAHKRRMALLGVLAVACGRPVGRERLVGLLWPELGGDAARHNLSESLYVLRKELGEGALLPAGSDLALSPTVVASDVARFEAALQAGDREAAVEAYGGPLLDGFYVEGAPEFERWVERERDRLARAYATALEALAEAAEEEGSLLRAVECWRRLAAHDPLSSRVALRLARALDDAGERPSALRAAESHTALVREELGVRPDPVLEAFVTRLRSETASPPPAPRPIAPPVEHTTHPMDAAPAVSPTEGEEPRRPEAAAAAPAAASREGSPSPPAPSRARRIRRRAMYALGAGLAGLALSLLGARKGVPPAPAAPRYDPRRIAVLYFDDESPRGEMQYLANGLTEMLIHELSQVPALDVVSRGGVKPYRDRAVRFDTLVADLRAGSVVEGTVQRSGDSVYVTVDLVDGNSRSHLESRQVARAMGDVVALERAVAAEVSASLRRRLGEQVRLRQARAETASAAARDLVLRAEQLRESAAQVGSDAHPLDAGSAERMLVQGDSLLALAGRADPAWTRPLLDRGWVALDRSRLADTPARGLGLADAAVERAGQALARQPGNAEALELRGTAAWRVAGPPLAPSAQAARTLAAERDLRAAVAIEPERAGAWATLSQLLRAGGRLAEADLTARRALAEDAYLDQAPQIRNQLYLSALLRGDFPAAARECDGARRQFPADWRFVECRLTLMREDPARPPDVEAGWRLVEELDRLDPPSVARAQGRAYSPLYRRALVAALLARAGLGDSARAVLARARASAQGDRESAVALGYDEASVLLLLGDRAGARRALDAYLAARPTLRPFVERDPLFRPLFAR